MKTGKYNTRNRSCVSVSKKFTDMLQSRAAKGRAAITEQNKKESGVSTQIVHTETENTEQSNMTNTQGENILKTDHMANRVHIPEAREHAAAGRQYYTDYEKDLITEAARTHMTALELAERFATDPLCTPRSVTALGYQLSTERDRQGLKKNYGHYGSRRNKSDFSTPAEQIDMERRDLEGRELPTLDLTQVTPGTNTPTVEDAALAVNNDIRSNRDVSVAIATGGLTYKEMQMNVGLLKLFAKSTRAVAGEGTKKLFVCDLANFWRIDEDEAAIRIDSLIRHRFPLSREGKEIYLIEPKHVFGNGMVNIQIDNVPTRELPGGTVCTSVGILSDTHYGAKGCAENMINEFYQIAHEAYGVRCFLHAGDFFDGSGVYAGQSFEQNFLGFDTQISEVAWKYPFYSDTETYAIGGNHDEAYLKAAGANILFALHNRRRDIIPIGLYQALISINGFNINLHHAAGSCNGLFPESKLNAVRKRKDDIVEYFDIDHIDLAVVGHFHRTGYLTDPKDCRVKSIVFGGSFQEANPFSTRLTGVTSVLGGYVANLYKFPNGSKHVDVLPVFFSLKERDDIDHPKTVHIEHLGYKESEAVCS